MKIASIAATVVSIPRRRALKTAYGVSPDTRTVVVKMQTDEGVIGWGQTVAPAPWGGASVEVVKLQIDSWLAPALLGEDPFNIESAASTHEGGAARGGECRDGAGLRSVGHQGAGAGRSGLAVAGRAGKSRRGFARFCRAGRAGGDGGAHRRAGGGWLALVQDQNRLWPARRPGLVQPAARAGRGRHGVSTGRQHRLYSRRGGAGIARDGAHGRRGAV